MLPVQAIEATKEIKVKPSQIWIEQCEAARGIEAEFGTQKALAYLIDEKFINFLEAAEDDPEFRSEIPDFVAEIKTIFERWQLAEYLEKARQTEPFDPDDYDDLDFEGIQSRVQEAWSAFKSNELPLINNVIDQAFR